MADHFTILTFGHLIKQRKYGIKIWSFLWFRIPTQTH